MAVVIPKLERAQPVAPGSVGRIEANAPNLLGATAPARQGLASAIDDVTEAYKEVRKKEIATKDLKATEYAVKYEQKLKSDLDKAALMKGDPTQVYKKFDEDMTTLENSIYDEVGEDEETRTLLREKIIKANGRIADTRNTNQTKQYYGWQKEVADSSVKLRQDNAMKAASYLDINNPATFGGVRSQLDEIEGTRIAIAVQNGYDIKQVDEERVDPLTGQKYRFKGWDYSNAPAVEAQIKADIGEAVIPMVKSLNAAGKVAEAKELIRDQKKWLNAADLAKLTANLDEADVRNQALALVGSLKNKSGRAAFDEIATSNKSDAIKFKARELVDTYDRQNQNALDRKRKDANNFLYNFIDEVQRSPTPFVTIAQFKDSPQYREYKDVLTPSDMRALEQRIEAPPSSDPAALTKISEAYMKDGFKNLSTADFNKLLVGLDQQARNRYTALRESVVKPPNGMTEGQARSRMEAMNTYFMADAKAAGIVPKTEMNKWNEKDQEYYRTKVEPAWIEFYSKIEDGLTDPTAQKAKVRDFIKEFTANPENTPPSKSFLGFSYGSRDLKQLPELRVKAKVPNSPMATDNTVGTLGPQKTIVPKNVKPASRNVDILSMSAEQYDYWVDQYIKETGTSSEPEDPAEFQAWINKKVSK